MNFILLACRRENLVETCCHNKAYNIH